jgi:hypothetical protein
LYAPIVADGSAVVRLAQLRGRIAALARGGHYDLTIDLLGELARIDLALGLSADGVQRARQAAQLAEERGEPSAGPLVVLGATLLAAGGLESAVDACAAAIARALPGERARVEVLARLVGGSAQRRLGKHAEARVLLDAARGAAARLGEAALAGLALAELAWIDLADDRPAAAAACFSFAAQFFVRAHLAASATTAARVGPDASLEADTLAVACLAAANADDTVERAAIVRATARAVTRPDLVAYLDGVLADLALRRNSADAAQVAAKAADSAAIAGTAPPLGGELAARARLRQVRTAADARERARHLEAGIELALALDRTRAGAQLGTLLVALFDDAARAGTAPARVELERLAAAIAGLGDAALADLATSVLAELSG